VPVNIIYNAKIMLMLKLELQHFQCAYGYLQLGKMMSALIKSDSL
jgi:hypothetical protein